MFDGGSLAGIVHLLALVGCWMTILYGISVVYIRTVERFDHVAWRAGRHRFLREVRPRMRL